MSSGRDGDPLQRAFAPLLGLPAWSVQKGHGSFLTMEFGEPHLLTREPTQAKSRNDRVRARLGCRIVKPVGEWHLWVYCCCWCVVSKDAQIASSESSDAEIHAAANEIDGQILVKVKADPDKGTSAFEFDLGASLHTGPWEDDRGVEQWMLYAQRSGQVFSYRGDGHYSWGPDSEKSDEMVWRSLRSGRTPERDCKRGATTTDSQPRRSLK